MAVVYGSPRIVAISAILWNMKTQQKSSYAHTNSRQNSPAVVQTRIPERVSRQERITYFLTQDELRQLFKVIRSKRDKAIFLVAYKARHEFLYIYAE